MNDKIHVVSCDLCKIFTEKNIVTKMYWPNTIDEVPESEFVIVECQTCRIPMVVISEHLTDITKEQWGRILYRCRKIFGGNITLKKHHRKIRDHLHYHVYMSR